MTMYALIENGAVAQYPVGIPEITKKHPNTSFSLPLNPEELEEFGVAVVKQIDPPSFNPKTQITEETTPTFQNGELTQTWAILDLSPEKIQDIQNEEASKVRRQRNILLADCDWTQLSDAPVNSSAWTIYRQELRDITSQSGFPWDVVWPTKP